MWAFFLTLDTKFSIMIVYNLNKQLNNLLPQADEIYLAIALIKEHPLNQLLNKVPKKANIKIIVGLDLPTTVETLQFLYEEQKSNTFLEAVMFFDKNKTFHPKLYVLKIKTEYVAFIGSANLTNGGLSNNFELTYKITKSNECIELLEWFKNIYNSSFPISLKNIEEYKSKTRLLYDKKNQKLNLNFHKNLSQFDILDKIDFSDRFFKKEHHLAFREELWYDNSLESNKERKQVEDKFLDFNNIIFQKFYEFGLIDLHTNREGSIVSRHHQINESAPRRLNAMWLSYGKSQEDIKIYKSYVDKEQKELQTFIHHARLQIRIELLKIGVWLLFGKENKGSIFDRDHFKKNMRDSSFRNNFYKLLILLPKEYWIRIDDEIRDCNSFNTAEELYQFCKKDNIDKYFIIGRNYEIKDVEVSENNLPNTVLLEFQRLYPLYIKMKHKI